MYVAGLMTNRVAPISLRVNSGRSMALVFPVFVSITALGRNQASKYVADHSALLHFANVYFGRFELGTALTPSRRATERHFSGER
jgi:hypothetical protein